MSALILWVANKTVTLTGQRRHHHQGGLVAPNFAEPTLALNIEFKPAALAAAIARTATLRNAPPELLIHIRDSALSEVQILLAEGSDFELSTMLSELADSERTHFASRIGAGITDIYMNALGYTWRDNAVCLSSSLKPHADFLYHGPCTIGFGAVLAEARGSFANNVSGAKMAAEAQRKYLRQVRPYIGKGSPYGTVIHGYSIAFGSKPGKPGAFLQLSQTLRTKRKLGKISTPTPIPGSLYHVPTAMALATYRSNFILMEALPVANWIDWLLEARDVPEETESVTFFRLSYAGSAFLVPANVQAPFSRLRYWLNHQSLLWLSGHSPLYLFAIEESVGTAFLARLSEMIQMGPLKKPETLELPVSGISGFSDVGIEMDGRRSTREDYDYALFSDGLALLTGDQSGSITDIVTWHSKEGVITVDRLR